MAILTIALAAIGLALPLLVLVRLKSDSGNPGPLLGATASVAAYVFGGGLVLGGIVGLLSLPILPKPVFGSDAWFTTLLAGATVGTILFISLRILLHEVSLAAIRWSLRLPKANPESRAEKLLRIVGGTAGFAVIFAAMFLVAEVVAPLGELWLVPFFALFATAFPLYETMLLPWFQYLKSPTTPPSEMPEVQQWLGDICREHDIPRFQLRIQEGDLANAFAIGGVVRHMVVIGGGLMQGMTTAQIKAILAHELAHVMRRDVPRLLLPMAIICGTFYFLTFYYYISPLFRQETVASMLGGMFGAMLAAGVLYILIPGFFMRRMEYRTDRLAVELLGDGEELVGALLRLAKLNDNDVRATSWSHPSTRDRVKAIRRLARDDE